MKSILTLGSVAALAAALSACMSNQNDTGTEAADDGSSRASVTYQPYALEQGGREETVTVSMDTTEQGDRVFQFETTQPQRDDNSRRRHVRDDDSVRVTTGDVLFDGLFALAMDDLRLLSVDEIRDASYNQGESIPCDCFQTGEKWHYVWTRDLAYAADLALSALDPERVANSLRFKTSDFREGVAAPEDLPENSLQIIQDTGSGGSWAVSTDRVSWSVAARRTERFLSGERHTAFADYAYRALLGTVEADRTVAYDPVDGLYGGEQSYLDWRVQTYAPWIIDNLSQMAESKALSTNVMHYHALTLTADWAAQRGESARAERYQQWATALKAAINQRFWNDSAGLYASLTSSNEVPVVVGRFDMLGNALAILYGVAPEERARSVMAQYPHAPFGVPVYYPQQPDMYVYHNRAIWPFVTAYSMKAAASVKNVKATDNAIDSLIRGAALNISNMENFEWLTAKPYYDDGPAINSRRQLWSVAGYLAMVMETVFGYHVDQDGIRLDPFLTTRTRARLGDSAELEGLNYRGKPLTIELALPPASGVEGYYEVVAVELNGAAVDGVISSEQLDETDNRLMVHFGDVVTNDQSLTMAPSVDPLSHRDPRVFAPTAPTELSASIANGGVELSFSDEANADVTADSVTYTVYRNGEPVTENLNTTQWTDASAPVNERRLCYAVEAVFAESGHRSHPSAPTCVHSRWSQTIDVGDSRVSSNVPVTTVAEIAQPVLFEWGAPDDQLAVRDIDIEQAGQYALRLYYNNRQHTIDSGVTNAIKRVEIMDQAGNAVTQGIVQMPNVEDRDGRHPLRYSTDLVLTLEPGTYQLSLSDYFNMSYLRSNKTYVGSGGIDGPVNKSSIAAFQIDYLGTP